MRDTFISVIIPAYNEKRRLPETLERVWFHLEDNFRRFEIIVVDDGSVDGTPEVVTNAAKKYHGFRLINNGDNRGKGYSVRNGVLNSEGEVILFSDADLSTPIDEIDKLLSAIEQGADIAVGSRGLKESKLVIRQPWYCERMGRICNAIVRFFIIGQIRDTQCGFKAFKRTVALRIFEPARIEGFGFDVEILFLARKFGYSVAEIPVMWFNSPASSVKMMKDSLNMFIDIFRIRWNWLRGRYKR